MSNNSLIKCGLNHLITSKYSLKRTKGITLQSPSELIETKPLHLVKIL